MKKERVIGIYKITSLSNKIYIGQSWDIYQRWKAYEGKNETSLGRAIYDSIMKYGIINHYFEILIELPEDSNQTALDKYETYFYNKYKNAGYKMLNIKPTGANGKHSEETKKRISNSCKGLVKMYKKGRKNAAAKEIFEYKDAKLIKVWPSRQQLADSLNIHVYRIKKLFEKEDSFIIEDKLYSNVAIQ